MQQGERPPMTPTGNRRYSSKPSEPGSQSARKLNRSHSRGSISSIASTSTVNRYRTPQKYKTWNPSRNGALTSAKKSWKESQSGLARASVSSNASTCSGSSSNLCVKVMVRIRPFLEGRTSSDSTCVQVLQKNNNESEDDDDDESTEGKPTQTSIQVGGEEGAIFTFDRIFETTDHQETVFIDAGKPIAESALSGFNASIFAYGQTGSGKTYTMQGSDDGPNRGLIPRVLEYCFVGFEALKKEGVAVVVHCSYMEIYNEQVFDLLDSTTREQANAPGYALASKNIRENAKRGVFVEGSVKECVETLHETLEHIKNGSTRRHVASTNMNRESSRSHSIFTLTIEIKTPADDSKGAPEVIKTSRVNLVDLAGSERQRATGTTGDRLNEAKHINKSLSALGHVISALVERSKGNFLHIPHRNSSLTYLLRDSLGGNTKTSIIATVSPEAMCFQDTLSTLKFGQRAKHIKNVVKANTTMTSNVDALQREVRRLREQLRQVSDMPLPQTPVQTKTVMPPPKPVVEPENIAERLEKNPDYKRITNKVNETLGTKGKGNNDGQNVLRERLIHLERVLVELLGELASSRECLGNMSGENRSRKELEEVLKDSIATKDLILHLQEQKLEALDQNKEFKSHEEVLKKSLETVEELELRAEIAQLKAENASLATLYKENPGNETAKRRIGALQIQMEALLEDKAELERMVKGLGEEVSILKEEVKIAESSSTGDSDSVNEAAVSSKSKDEMILALEQELKVALEKNEQMEQELFAATEQAAGQGDQLPKTPSASTAVHRDKSRRRFSDYAQSTTDKDSLSPTTSTARAVMLVAAAAQKSARNAVNQEVSSSLVGASTGDGANDTVSSVADNLVCKRLLAQLADTRKSLKEEKRQNKRYSVQLERRRSLTRKQKKDMRKSLSAKINDIDTEHLKTVKLELQLQDLREKYERVFCTNKELHDAVTSANAYAEYQKKLQEQQSNQIKELKKKLERKEVSKENDGGMGNRYSTTSSSQRDSTQTVRMSTFGGKTPTRDSLESCGTCVETRASVSTTRNSLSSIKSSSCSLSARNRKLTDVSVAEFFPLTSSEATQLAKQDAQLELEDAQPVLDISTSRIQRPRMSSSGKLQKSKSFSVRTSTSSSSSSKSGKRSDSSRTSTTPRLRTPSFRFSNLLPKFSSHK